MDYGLEFVQWNPHLEYSNIVLTSAPNAFIFLWDITQNTKDPLQKYTGHTNKTKVSWSYHDPNIFISGSLDKKIFLWDSRGKQKVLEFPNK